MKRKESGFTTIELLTVVAIIAILVGLLIPALSTVRSFAKKAKQKAQITTIELALVTFKNDYGDYPPSDYIVPPGDYCGAQKLSEALLGWDLLGFHPDSAWRADGLDISGGLLTYDPPTPGTLSMDKRRGPYLELSTTSSFRLGDLFVAGGTGTLSPGTFVICDVYGISERRIMLANGKAVTPGTPILYYRANTSSKSIINDPAEFENNIYNIRDNGALVSLGKIKDGTPHPLWEPYVFYSANGGVIDPKVTAKPWPYRPDSFILISAGADGLYGTSDDIRNFGD